MSSDTVKYFTGILYFFSECNFHLFLYWSSSDTLLSSDGILGPAFSYAVCTYETRYWAQPFPMQFEHMGSIGPHIYIHIYTYTHTHTHIYIYIYITYESLDVKKLYLTLQKLKTSILRMKFSPKIPNIK